eukprot:3070045-Rhodomonas_salina.1
MGRCMGAAPEMTHLGRSATQNEAAPRTPSAPPPVSPVVCAPIERMDEISEVRAPGDGVLARRSTNSKSTNSKRGRGFESTPCKHVAVRRG